MTVSEEIKKVKLEQEFRVCPTCGYERGFHVSLLRSESEGVHYKIVLICPNCGSRFDGGWEQEV